MIDYFRYGLAMSKILESRRLIAGLDKSRQALASGSVATIILETNRLAARLNKSTQVKAHGLVMSKILAMT